MLNTTPEARADVLLVFVDPVLIPPAQPYGAQIIATTLASRGIRAITIWPHLAPDSVSALRAEVQRVNPAIVAFSFRNLDTASVDHEQPGSFAVLLERHVRSVRDHAITVIGGSGYSIDPIRLLRTSSAHIGFVGPSEHDFAEFCHRILQGSTLFEAAMGLSTTVLPDAETVPRLRPQRLGTALTLHETGLTWARLAGGTVPIRTKTGCSLRCSYCVVPTIEAIAYRDWHEIERELSTAVAADCADRVFIADGEFNLPDPKRAIEITRRIHNRFGSTLKWRCYLEAGFIPDELPLTLRQAGCTAVSLTVDSLSDTVRILLGKQRNAATAIRGVEKCLAAGLTTNVNILAGAPGETLQSLEESAIQLRRLVSASASVFIAVGLRIYPRTPLAVIASEPSHSKYVQQDAADPALANYCAPLPTNEVQSFLSDLLTPSSQVVYLPVARDDVFYKRLAAATSHLQDNPDLAAEYFRALELETVRPEATLGSLYAERQLRQVMETEIACH